MTSIMKDESPAMLEARRMAIVNQASRLQEYLQRAGVEADEYRHLPEKILLKNKKTQRWLNELVEDEEDPALK